MRSINSAFFNDLQGEGLILSELIEITTPNSIHLYCTDNDTIVRSGNEYTPFPGASLQGVEERIDMTISAIDFFVSNSGGLFDSILDSNGLDFADVKIERVFPHTPDMGAYTVFTGKIADQGFNRNTITGQVRNAYDSANIKIPHYNYQDGCSWRFGSDGCAFDTSSLTITGSLVSVESGGIFATVTSGTLTQSYSNGWFDLGRLTFTSGVNSGQIRTVRFHNGDTLDLSHPLPFAVATGDLFSAFPGCRKRLVEDCRSRFDNTSNFLGFPWIPKQQTAI